MIRRLSKLAVGIIGSLTTFIAIKELFSDGIVKDNTLLDSAITFLIVISVFFIFYVIASVIINNLPKIVDRFEGMIKNHKYSSYEFMLGCFGAIIGLIVANLACIPILAIKFVGIPITLMVNMVIAYLGYSIILRFKNDRFLARFKRKYEEDPLEAGNGKILDTSVIIDGRIYDILNAGFIEGTIIVPQFVIDELGRLADSEDGIKRGKGRKGLDLLNNMQKEFNDKIELRSYEVSSSKGVDELLVEIALKERLSIITNDFNLNKIAKIRNIIVFNINELANALKPLANVGESIRITISKQGKERQQGIGYLESGTMVVVENTKNMIGETVTAIVTSVIQTQAGRMIFANLSE